MRSSIFTIAVIIHLIALAGNAYAYTDPGTGFMIWQLLVSVFVGGIFYCRKFIASLFRCKKKEDEN